jgi:uncharacterized protein YjcR
MGKRSDLEPLAIRYYAEGMEIPQISVELAVSENSLREWKKRAGKEWDEARANFRKGAVASFEDVGRRVQRAREITTRLTGNATSQGKMGLVLNEAVQTMVFDLIGQMQTTDLLDEEKLTASVEQLQRVANTLQKLEQAANLNLKREQEIRQQALKDAAAQVVATPGKKGGLSDEAANEIRKKILGIGA